MTDKYYALTVVLEKDIRDDNSENITNAISMIKGVLSVKGNVANPDTYMAEERALMDLRKKLIDTFFKK